MAPEEAFFENHKDLPREAPGSEATTQKMLDIVKEHADPKIALDIGCGPGSSSIVLAKNGINVTAVDTHQPFLDELCRRATAAGVGDLITPINKPMEDLNFGTESFDLIWAEGSAYLMGWENALSRWQKFIKHAGFIIASECCWLTTSPSQECKEFWNESYPAMRTKDQAADAARSLQYKIVDMIDFTDDDWQEYYGPLEARRLRFLNDTREEMQIVLSSTQKEIEIRRRYKDEYNYIGFILQR